MRVRIGLALLVMACGSSAEKTDAGFDATSDGLASDTGTDASGDGDADAGPTLAVTLADISAGQGMNSGMYPSLGIDTVGSKLLVATEDFASNDVGLFRCELDGTACAYTNVGTQNGPPSLIVDQAHSRFFVATQDNLITCDLAATNCTTLYMSLFLSGYSSLGRHSVAIDTVNQELVLANTYGIVRCNLDTLSDAGAVVSCVQKQISGLQPSDIVTLMIANGKLVIEASPQPSLISIIRCDLDGTGCTTTSANDPFFYGPDCVALDAPSGKIIGAGPGTKDGTEFFRFNLDGTGSTQTAAPPPPYDPSTSTVNPACPVVDSSHSKLLFPMITNFSSTVSGPGLIRCDLDETGCTLFDISTGATSSLGVGPVAPTISVLDASSKHLLVPVTVGASQLLGLLIVTL